MKNLYCNVISTFKHLKINIYYICYLFPAIFEIPPTVRRFSAVATKHRARGECLKILRLLDIIFNDCFN
jgi:hypothetical protein